LKRNKLEVGLKLVIKFQKRIWTKSTSVLLKMVRLIFKDRRIFILEEIMMSWKVFTILMRKLTLRTSREARKIRNKEEASSLS